MKRKALISFGVIAAISFALATEASAQKKTNTVGEDRKVKKIEDAGAFLGIYMEELEAGARRERDYPKSAGVLVTKVIEDSPAEKAGIEEGDIIYLFAGQPVEGSRQLGEMVSTRKPGDKVEIVLYRKGGKKTIDVALAERRTSYVTIDIGDGDLDRAYMVMNKLGEPGVRAIFGGRGGEWSFMTERPILGVSLHELSDDLAPYFDVKAGEGVLVLDVHENSPAAEAGMKAGDVIVEIAGARVSRYDDVVDALEDFEEGDKAAVTVVRKGRKIDMPVEIERGGGGSLGLMRLGHDKVLEKHKIKAPGMKAIRIQEIEDRKLEEKMKELEKQLEELRGKLKEMEKSN